MNGESGYAAPACIAARGAAGHFLRRMLQRYLLRELLAPLAAWTGFLGFTFLMVAFVRGSEVLLGSAVHLADAARILGLLIPQLLAQALPVAFLLAILLGLGRLSEDGELRSMQALGVSPVRFFVAPLSLGLALTLLQATLGFTLQPWGLAAATAHVNEVIRRNLMSDIKPGVFHDEAKGFTFYAESNGKNGGWNHVLLMDERDPERPLLLVARAGEARLLPTTGELTFDLRHGSIHQDKRTTDEYSRLSFGRAEIRAGLDEERHRNRLTGGFDAVTPFDLRDEAVRAAGRDEPALPWETAYHWRLGQLLMPLAFALLGAPMAVLRRAGRNWGFVFTLIGFAAYYALARSGAQAAVTGKLPPLVGGQLANVVFLVLGVALMARIAKRGSA
jgi:lipopolysaccharide export system permease protein